MLKNVSRDIMTTYSSPTYSNEFEFSSISYSTFVPVYFYDYHQWIYDRLTDRWNIQISGIFLLFNNLKYNYW